MALNQTNITGLVNESVMQKIWDISKIPLPFTDAIGKGTHDNIRCEFTTDELAAPVTNNAQVDGADQTGDDTKVGERLGNFTQIATKQVKVSTTAEASNSIGGVAKLANQIRQRQLELRRDVEAQMLTQQGSAAGDSNTTPGISAGIGAQLKTNVSVGATGAVGGYNSGTGLFVAPTPGTKRALSEATVRDILQAVYEAGGNTSMLMATPNVIRKMSEYMFTSTAKVATMTSTSPADRTAYGSVNVFITDFGQTVDMRDNRLQPLDAAGVSSMYFLDPTHLQQSIMRGYQVEPLAKTGLAEKRLMSVEYSLLVLNEKSQGAIFDIDETLAMVA